MIQLQVDGPLLKTGCNSCIDSMYRYQACVINLFRYHSYTHWHFQYCFMLIKKRICETSHYPNINVNKSINFKEI